MAHASRVGASRRMTNPRPPLAVEQLESRETPGGLNLPHSPIVGGPPLSPIPVQPGPFNNQAPVISGFKAIVGPNGRVTFTGTVTDDQPVAGYVVRITGPGVDVAAIVRDDGTFQVTTTVMAPGDVTVAARVTDGFGATSDPAYTTFTPTW
jgi:hypothetical protein